MTTTKSLGASPHTTTNADIVISYMGGGKERCDREVAAIIIYEKRTQHNKGQSRLRNQDGI